MCEALNGAAPAVEDQALPFSTPTPEATPTLAPRVSLPGFSLVRAAASNPRAVMTGRLVRPLSRLPLSLSPLLPWPQRSIVPPTPGRYPAVPGVSGPSPATPPHPEPNPASLARPCGVSALPQLWRWVGCLGIMRLIGPVPAPGLV